ncbi:TetR/AcrR family transcriptional regulator [Rhizobium sp. C4]|uniref:TetR/AcrR family transcriptional regulator n=1 Tax=Rhizobium sp. C4 TaxID=1349800 RepID=UPI001E441D76|nr:TetR/AcrR family transcriptional regulator [Rhizobium sp. C4]MCD2174797.1 TetR/AcrR family transcriptional regulator [Rhizobium sp. C4]
MKQAGRPRTKPAPERREDLMIAAERVFLAKGFENATIEEIAKGAGISKGAFYLHFTTKIEVAEALRDRFVQRLLNEITKAVEMEPEPDFRARLQTWARACAHGYLVAAAAHKLAFSAAPPPKDGLTNNILIDDLRNLLSAGQSAGCWRVEEPALTAIFLFNALHGAIGMSALETDSFARVALLRALAAHFLRTVEAKA